MQNNKIVNQVYFLNNLKGYKNSIYKNLGKMNVLKRLKTLYAPYKIKVQFFIQTMLKRKSYLAIGFFIAYLPVTMMIANQYEKQTSLWMSKNAQYMSEVQIPTFLRNVLFNAYSKYYNVNTQQMLKPFSQYKTFSQFFTRKVKQRNLPIQKQNQRLILSPADSRVLSYGQVNQDSVFVVKDYSYSLGHLLCGQEITFSKQEIDQIKKIKNNKLYHIVLYLAPGDYHRFHSMTKFNIMRRKIIDGALLSVNEKTLRKKQKVYEKNSRLILHGKWDQGYLGMILVGALNVGRIIVKDKMQYSRGQQIGYFNLGSTIVLLIQSSKLQWEIQHNKKVKYGDIIAKINIQKA